MHVFNEVKQGRQSIFEKHVLDEHGNSILRTETHIRLHAISEGAKDVYLIYDDEMRVISEAYVYLNSDLAASPPNTRKKAAYALRLLYCYLSLSGIGPGRLDDSSVIELRQFLRGAGNAIGRYSLKTQRDNNTVNGYFSVYRDYFSKRGIECEALNHSRVVAIESKYDGGVLREEKIRYTNNLPSKTYCERSVPKYVSPDEFRRLYQLAINAGDDTARLIMHLMYVFGLRIGEVLGLTLEDLTEEIVGGTHAPMLIIRNRASDRKFQHAKGRDHPLGPLEYGSRSYAASWQKVPIDYHTYEMLVDYANETHERMASERPRGYETARADLVSNLGDIEDNRYLFLNRYGRVLSGQTWGNALKRYFKEAGVLRGWDPSSDNLSHRFRHGFAMFHAHFRPDPVGVLQLQKMMRHKRVSSTMVYYNPTEEDEIKIKAAFQKSLYDSIPELKEALHAR